MFETVLMGLVTGVLFGTALFKVTALRYDRVVGMLLLTDVKIMKFAFSAIGVAALTYGLADILGVATDLAMVPRVMPFTGWAHLVGGVIFGVSMAATGFCPGTAACRAGVNMGGSKFESLFAVIGLFVGVAVFAAIKVPLFDAGVLAAPQGLTVHGWLGLSYGPVAVLVGAAFLVITALVDRFLPENAFVPARPLRGALDRVRGDWHFFPAGALAGLTIVWATTQGGYIGYSGSVLAIYGWAADAIGVPSALVPTISETIVWRSALLGGVVGGAVLAKLWSIPCESAGNPAPTPSRFRLGASARALGGGAGLALGAMIGGGCTTGAFMAAFPTLSIGSFAMGGTFFVAAMSSAVLLQRLRRAPAAGGVA